MKVGDRIHDNVDSTIIWTITSEKPSMGEVLAEYKRKDHNGIHVHVRLITYKELFNNYTKVDTSFDWSSGYPTADLPTGINKKPSQEECYHDYVKYVGFNEVYEFCKICDKKRRQQE